MSDGNDDWDRFDWNSWGEDSLQDESAPDDDMQRTDPSLPQQVGQHDKRRGATHVGQWVSIGGILHWEESDDGDVRPEHDVRSEAASIWADDLVDLPPGAPDAARVRAARAWLLKQRKLEAQALGYLLLEQRKEQRARELDSSAGSSETSYLELALAEQQAALDEYDTLLQQLDDVVDHSGANRALVEYYLTLTDRIVDASRAPEASDAFRQLAAVYDPDAELTRTRGENATARSRAEWQGRSRVLVDTKRRIEYVTTPEPED